MQIAPDEPAMLDHAEAVRLLHEMAAVVRTVFAVPAPSAAAAAAIAPAVPAPPAPLPVPAAPLPVPAALPVPDLDLPDHADSPDRRSLALLQEIAFLDD